MRKASYLAVLVIATVSLLGVFAASAYATPGNTAPCSTCHSGSGVTMAAGATAIGATSATYDIIVNGGTAAAGGTAWAAFDGSTLVDGKALAIGTITVPFGSSYNIFGVNGPSASDGLGTLTLHPAATDTTPPVTTSDVKASYVGDATIQLTASDNDGGWGVAYIYYKVDGRYVHVFTVGTTAATTVTVKAPATGSGASATHTISYWSQDWGGNVESRTAKTFTVKAAKTVTSLTLNRSTSTVRRNQYFKLYGKISPSAVRKVAIQYRKPGTTIWRTLVVRTTTATGAYSYRYHTSVKGYWSFRTKYSGSATSLGSYSRIVKVRVR